MRRRDAVLISVITVIAVAVVGVGVMVALDWTGQEPQEQDRTPQAVLAVKVDNVADARPQLGIDSADVVYVLPVEGGLTRLLVVYTDARPEVVGPVRSARPADLSLLPQYGLPTFAYSGAARELLPSVRQAPLVDASPDQAQEAYFRADDRAAPHNLFVRPAALPEPGQPPERPVFERGPSPVGGEFVDSHEISYPAADFTFTWSDEAEHWSIAMDGEPAMTDDGVALTATTIVEQRVSVEEDRPGAAGAVPRLIGSGDAVVLRDGQRFDATWSHREAEIPARFFLALEQEISFADGPIWVLVIPASEP